MMNLNDELVHSTGADAWPPAAACCFIERRRYDLCTSTQGAPFTPLTHKTRRAAVPARVSLTPKRRRLESKERDGVVIASHAIHQLPHRPQNDTLLGSGGQLGVRAGGECFFFSSSPTTDAMNARRKRARKTASAASPRFLLTHPI